MSETLKEEPKERKPDWQDNLLNLNQRAAHLFLSNTLSDVTFIVGNGPDCQTFAGHRFILAISSPVFQAMFFGPLASDKKEIKLDDDDPEAFKEILKYVYLDKSELTMENVINIVNLAKKYALIQLESHCMEFIFENINIYNVLDVYFKVTISDQFLFL